MVRILNADEVRRMRMRSQRLSGPRATDVPALLQQVGALQARARQASRLAVRPRRDGLGAQAVRRACNEERSVVRAWAMRGTLHMVPAEDVGWMVALLGPIFAAADRRRRLQLGLDDELCARALPALREILGGGRALTRAELVQRLAEKGVAIDPRGQVPAHLVGFAALQGLICRGPDRDDDEPTYVLLDEWVGPLRPTMEPEDALAELARRYLRAYAPVGVRDFAGWAGIALGQARRGFQRLGGETGAAEVRGEAAGGTGGTAPEPPDAAHPCGRLLPVFAGSLLGYRSPALAL